MDLWDAEGFRARMRLHCRNAEDYADAEGDRIRQKDSRARPSAQQEADGEASLYRHLSEMAIADTALGTLEFVDEVIARPERIASHENNEAYRRGVVRAARVVRREIKAFTESRMR